MLNKLFEKIGYAKGVRASGYIILGCMVIANILVKPRIPGRKHRPAHMQFPAPDMKAILRHDAYWATIAGGFLIIWGLFMPIFYLQVYAETHGIDKSFAFYSLSILNAASVFGRTIPNFLADTYGPFNMLVMSSVGAGIVIFAMFGATNVAGVVCFAIFYGFFSGAYVSLLPGCFASLSSHLGEVGVRMGFAWAIVSLAGLTGTPISGALLGNHGELHWWKAIVFSGIMVLAGSSVIFLARTLHGRRLGKSRI
jgi:predicted MFS family arabinose efflux permease